MSAVNTADLQLEAGPHARIVAVALPSNITVDFSLVNGPTKPANNADVTSTIMSSSGTSIVMAASNLFKSGTGLGGVFIGAGGLFGRDSSGSNTFSIDGSTGAASFTGDITGASNIDISGTANIHGTTTQTLFGGSRTAAVLINGAGVNSVGAWGFSSASGGMGLRGLGTGFNGTGMYGEGQGTAGSQSSGVAGSAINSGNYGVIGNGVLGAKGMLCVGDLEVQGAMTVGSTLQATNLNANYLQGFLASAFLQASATAVDSDALGGFGSGSWIRQTGVTAGNPGTGFTHSISGISGGVNFRIPIFVP